MKKYQVIYIFIAENKKKRTHYELIFSTQKSDVTNGISRDFRRFVNNTVKNSGKWIKTGSGCCE